MKVERRTGDLVILTSCQVRGSQQVALLALVSITPEGTLIIQDKRPLRDAPADPVCNIKALGYIELLTHTRNLVSISTKAHGI